MVRRVESRVRKLEESLGMTPNAAQVVKVAYTDEEAAALKHSGFGGTILRIVVAPPPPTCTQDSD